MALDQEANGLSSVYIACYSRSPNLNIPRPFKIVIYLIIEHIYTCGINTFPWQSFPFIYRSLRKCILLYVLFGPFFSQRPTMSSCSVATIQTSYSVGVIFLHVGLYLNVRAVRNKGNKSIQDNDTSDIARKRNLPWCISKRRQLLPIKCKCVITSHSFCVVVL